MCTGRRLQYSTDPGTWGFLNVLSLFEVDEGRELRVSIGADCQAAVARGRQD